jgi:membrane protein implicated in regulation of membrane protease activity
MENRDWTSITANIITLTVVVTFSIMLIVSVIILRDEMFVATIGSVMSGIVGVIITYYFDQRRVQSAQNQAEEQTRRAEEQLNRAAQAESDFSEAHLDYENLVDKYESLLNQTQRLQAAYNELFEEDE